ncbi:uncharacterized protein EV422DRAFT_503603 [Fimicolochytrium jonesii]|uniref:uncharacterized protein n=1 Tax=Fimicolochytrium jonesii TaxID=1396493 RepID=UPI0022FDC2B2|nr:uncharacterized protein EV422DRAFT_503603 [Fimicolochytrium jonesii]KAI8824791.1 hypothetical protein EV422DRAFT_503603 [Fimicolochytrium jonesii]
MAVSLPKLIGYSPAALGTTVISALVYINLIVATWVSSILAWAAGKPWYPFLPSSDTHCNPNPKSPRVAIIGAGITGVGAAAACRSAGVEVVIYEKSPTIGGVWSRVNKTSSLQFQALFYRFHPIVRFHRDFPHRDDILRELERVWKLYDLERRTRFNAVVKSVKYDAETKTYTVNGTDVYDGVISAVGTCDEVLIPPFEGLKDKYQGLQAHTSKMDKVDLDLRKGQKIVVLGSGASAVEVIDYVLNRLDGDESRLGSGPGQIDLTVVARHDKWIMPRGIILSTLASMIPPALGFLVEAFIRRYWYGTELRGMTPTRPFFSSTPCLNTRYLELIRTNKIRYIRGSIKNFESHSIKVGKIEWDSDSMIDRDAYKDPGEGGDVELGADVTFFATGFKKPTLSFIEDDVWRVASSPSNDEFKPPNLFNVAFPPNYPTMLFLNDAYVDAVATAGHIHIGLLTRLFVMFLLDPKTQPTAEKAAKWVRDRTPKEALDMKKEEWRSQGVEPAWWGGYDRKTAGLSFYNYGELLFWTLSTAISQPNRWRYFLFVLGLANSNVKTLAKNFDRPTIAAPNHHVNGTKALPAAAPTLRIVDEKSNEFDGVLKKRVGEKVRA